MPNIVEIIKTKLNAAFSPEFLEIEDESHQHAGHGGAAEHAAEFGDTPSHIHIEIEADTLGSISRLARHRAVMDAIADEVKVIHALRLTIR